MILVDTNILVAVANSRDDDHDRVQGFLENVSDALLVPPTVIAEVCYLLHERVGASSEVEFLRSFADDELELVELTKADLSRMADLAERYADLGLGGTDASIVAVAERLGVTKIATLDRRHFTVVIPDHVEAFILLPD